MGCRSVPEKVSEFLIKCSGRKYCDACIQERLGFKWRQQVQLVTATLAVTPCSSARWASAVPAMRPSRLTTPSAICRLMYHNSSPTSRARRQQVLLGRSG